MAALQEIQSSHILYDAASRFLVVLNAAGQDTVRRNFMSPSAPRANSGPLGTGTLPQHRAPMPT
ncbi:hypothetical protein RFM41_30370 [Mesorhizobium sp. VK25A]|uniref:KTSC domain-containing protein n=1 Tax=Mesorhizobium vachelliae TaxID=3072309 RepID=A0ABU5ACS9_9HYPH|nr:MULTISPECIES: hypothetical protein [unclassified Mesorhizobium]MDX8535255.1 hypothetical protein [Mesorhizobium sp. VK25D]MDX8548074.1 hypothetical protein [Mesorhizobium sp. VK25A]